MLDLIWVSRQMIFKEGAGTPSGGPPHRFTQPVPDAWLLHEQAEADEAADQVDFELQEKLEQLEAEQHFVAPGGERCAA